MSVTKDQSYGSAFLYAEDLLSDGKFAKAVVTIEAIHEPGTIQRADKQFVDKRAISFAGKSKMLVLCKTNDSLMKYATGDADPAKWVGKKITIVVRIVDAFGARVPAIRVWPTVPIRKGLVKFLGEEVK